MSTDSNTSFEEEKETKKIEKSAKESGTSKKINKKRNHDSGDEEGKNAKGASSKKSRYPKNEDGQEMIPIGKDRFVTVRGFKGKTYVDIREFYEDKGSGKLKPGRKGISLSREQYTDFKGILGEIDARLDEL